MEYIMRLKAALPGFIYQLNIFKQLLYKQLSSISRITKQYLATDEAENSWKF